VDMTVFKERSPFPSVSFRKCGHPVCPNLLLIPPVKKLFTLKESSYTAFICLIVTIFSSLKSEFRTLRLVRPWLSIIFAVLNLRPFETKQGCRHKRKHTKPEKLMNFTSTQWLTESLQECRSHTKHLFTETSIFPKSTKSHSLYD